VNVVVKAKVEADDSVVCHIDCDGQKATVTFANGDITLTVPESGGGQ
jgi:hypothetical protein